MESTNSSVNFTRRKKFKNNLSTLLIAVLLFLWTPALVGLTLKYQTSCPGPLLDWSEQSQQLFHECHPGQVEVTRKKISKKVGDFFNQVGKVSNNVSHNARNFWQHLFSKN
ncbi:hypothetical protein [Lyngbya sp. CCY1209]|jgi:hypothetical protein|uniref:hypothetical protein n=1 Tax=Lyngbya sp. CCY1209 TaxID=2886103 RepID=UPI002D2150CB|nr:hypothetical protein [Lyngbya sp. CCY1209]MEB3886534.1 hypothetical protein [Lyngbya sp. CCY1209]